MGKFLNPWWHAAWLESVSRLPIDSPNNWFGFPTSGGLEPRKQGVFVKVKIIDVFSCAGDPAWYLGPVATRQRQPPTNQPTNTMTTAFKSIPLVNLSSEATPDPLGFFETLAVNGMEGKFIRVSAASQRRHFCGTVPFGRRAIKFEDGKITVIRSVDFGRDFDSQEYYYDQFERVFRSTFDDRSAGLNLPR